MEQIQLKEIISDIHVKKFLEDYQRVESSSYIIYDMQDHVIYKEGISWAKEVCNIYVNECIIGKVVGDKKGIVIASFLTYAASHIDEKRKLTSMIEKRDKEIELLANLSERLSACVDSKEAAKLAAEHVVKFFNADAAALAVKNAHLFSSLQETFFQTVEALIGTIEKKDVYTAGHARRVADYSILIGKELGLNVNEIAKIKLAALLHDIGKIGIRDNILLKKSKLTEEEYAIIKKHPVFGAEILHNVEQLKDIVPFVRGHHERYDGGGYPDGCKENNIPFFARIISVADSYDAMTSQRPYNHEIEKEKAIYELKRNVYTQFDPVVVEAFTKVLSN